MRYRRWSEHGAHRIPDNAIYAYRIDPDADENDNILCLECAKREGVTTPIHEAPIPTGWELQICAACNSLIIYTKEG